MNRKELELKLSYKKEAVDSFRIRIITNTKEEITIEEMKSIMIRAKIIKGNICQNEIGFSTNRQRYFFYKKLNKWIKN